MSKAELVVEIGYPKSSLQLGNKELHLYEESRKVEIVDDRVVTLTGFPESMINASEIVPQATVPKIIEPPEELPVAPEPAKESITLNSETIQDSESKSVLQLINEFSPQSYAIGGGTLIVLLIALIILKRSHKEIEQEHSGKTIDAPSPFENPKPAREPVRIEYKDDDPSSDKERPPKADPERSALSIRDRSTRSSEVQISRKPLVRSGATSAPEPASKPTSKPIVPAVENSEPSPETDNSSRLKLRHD